MAEHGGLQTSLDCGTGMETPAALERAEVPRYFRQFRDASVLKKLAHSRTGPLYQLIGRKAWYDTADILAWLAARKSAGPAHPHPAADADRGAAPPADKAVPKKRGRPTKTEQRLRREAAEKQSSPGGDAALR